MRQLQKLNTLSEHLPWSGVCHFLSFPVASAATPECLPRQPHDVGGPTPSLLYSLITHGPFSCGRKFYRWHAWNPARWRTGRTITFSTQLKASTERPPSSGWRATCPASAFSFASTSSSSSSMMTCSHSRGGGASRGLDLCHDLGQSAFNSRASWVLVLSRAAFVLSRTTRSAILSMRASSCSSFWVSRTRA